MVLVKKKNLLWVLSRIVNPVKIVCLLPDNNFKFFSAKSLLVVLWKKFFLEYKIVSAAIIKCLLYCLYASSAFNKDILLTKFWGVSLTIGVSSMLGWNTLKGILSFLRISCLANDEEDKIILLILIHLNYLCLKIILPFVKS